MIILIMPEEEQLGKYGYEISYGIEDKDSMQYEIAHLYRNGCRNIRFTDGKDNELIVSREEEHMTSI